jgi:hypothetical protein
MKVEETIVLRYFPTCYSFITRIVSSNDEKKECLTNNCVLRVNIPFYIHKTDIYSLISRSLMMNPSNSFYLFNKFTSRFKRMIKRYTTICPRCFYPIFFPLI